MKKSNIRDYGVSAFRYYAMAEKNKKSLILPENERLASGCILDILAVEKTLRDLEKTSEGEQMLKVLKTVYFTMPERNLKKGEISSRVILAGENIHASEATIYRILNRVTNLFAQNRGLRVSLF
ncbi:MAG: hypothetical protein IKT39_00785 [Clostridia bacterium]|nr:hypothetical protein [Clostridia bacterium]